MGFTSPPPPPDKVAQSLWQLSVTITTGSAPELTAFSALPAEEQKHWLSLAILAIGMIHPAPTPPSSTT